MTTKSRPPRYHHICYFTPQRKYDNQYVYVTLHLRLVKTTKQWHLISRSALPHCTYGANLFSLYSQPAPEKEEEAFSQLFLGLRLLFQDRITWTVWAPQMLTLSLLWSGSHFWCNYVQQNTMVLMAVGLVTLVHLDCFTWIDNPTTTSNNKRWQTLPSEN